MLSSGDMVILLELFSQRSNHILHSLHQASSIKNRLLQNNKIKVYQYSNKLVKYKEFSCFGHSGFPAHLMFIVDVCCDSLGTSIFGDSSSAASNTRSRLPSKFLSVFYDYDVSTINQKYSHSSRENYHK